MAKYPDMCFLPRSAWQFSTFSGTDRLLPGTFHTVNKNNREFGFGVVEIVLLRSDCRLTIQFAMAAGDRSGGLSMRY